MTQPLAIVLYEKLLPGSQLVNRLQDLNYRVQTISDPRELLSCVEKAGPMVVLMDLESEKGNVLDFVPPLRAEAKTRHIPVIAFVDEVGQKVEKTALQAGVTLVASDLAVLNHLPQILQQALQME